jgi:hypothetical protein
MSNLFFVPHETAFDISQRRSRMLIQTVLSAILAASLPGVNPGGTSLLGRVSDGATPIAGAIVTISSRDFVKSTITDENGRFTLQPVPAGRYDFRTSAQRYAVFESHVIVHGGDSHRNWIRVTDLIPVDQQTVSVADLIRHQQPAAIVKGVRGPAADGQSLR